MEATFAERQRTMVEGDLPGWNRTNTATAASGGIARRPTGTGNIAHTAILQSLQLLLQQSQTQGPVAPARRVKKPSEQWEGTINLLLRLTGISAEDNLPPFWLAWANCNKKEACTLLQEHLRENARSLGLPEPVPFFPQEAVGTADN